MRRLGQLRDTIVIANHKILISQLYNYLEHIIGKCFSTSKNYQAVQIRNKNVLHFITNCQLYPRVHQTDKPPKICFIIIANAMSPNKKIVLELTKKLCSLLDIQFYIKYKCLLIMFCICTQYSGSFVYICKGLFVFTIKKFS